MSPHTPPTAYRRQVAVSFAAFLFVVGFLLVVPATVQAETSTVEARQQFDLPAGSARPMLRQFAAQAKQEIVFDADTVAGFTTNAVKGEISAREALERMLAGTGLVASQDKSGAFAVRRETERELKNVNRAIASDSGRPERNGKTDLDENGQPIVKLDTFEVFGKKTLNMDIRRSPDDIQPYVVFDRNAIDNSGASDVGEFLRKRLAMNIPTYNYDQSPGPQGNATNINLRGMGEGQTLILVDGRRAGSYSLTGDFVQADLNMIPLSAIERIDVLPMSASGIYGGGATGGVVNVVLRHDYSGVEVSAHYENSFDTDSAVKRIDLNGGVNFNHGKTAFLFNGTISETNPLLAQDRDFYARGRALILANNPAAYLGANANPPSGGTTNIRSNAPLVGGVRPNLTLKGSNTSLGAPSTYVPYGYSGVGSDNGAGLIANAGKYNYALSPTAINEGGAREALSAQPTFRALRASLRHEFSTKFSVYTEFSASERHSEFQRNPFPTVFTIPGSSAANPFNEDVVVNVPTLGGDQIFEAWMTDVKWLGGLLIRLPWKDWNAGVDYSFERSTIKSSGAIPGISAAGTAAVTNGTLNVFRDVNAFPVNFAPYQTGLTTIVPLSTTLENLTLRAGGAVFSLPAGDASLSMNAEHSRQRIGDYHNLISSVNLDVYYPSRRQLIDAMYMELHVPVISPNQHIPVVRRLEFQLAGRYDKYKNDTANSVTILNGNPLGTLSRGTNRFDGTVPTFGIKYEPIADLAFRASYAGGFTPPSLIQLVPGADQSLPNGVFGLTDPLRGNQPVNYPVTELIGGNPNLQPERSISRALGVVVTPSLAPGLRVSMDLVRTQKLNNIGSLGATPFALSVAQYIPGLVTRAAPLNDGFSVGPITTISIRPQNFARAEYESIDYGVAYTRDLASLGSLEVGLQATETKKYIVQFSSATSASLVSLVDTASAPHWNGNSFATWTKDNLTIGWSAQYYGAYWYSQTHVVDVNQGQAKAPSIVYHDVFVRYAFNKNVPKHFNAFFAKTDVTFGVKNLFNREPRIDVSSGNNSTGFFDQRADPRLATYYITVRKAY